MECDIIISMKTVVFEQKEASRMDRSYARVEMVIICSHLHPKNSEDDFRPIYRPSGLSGINYNHVETFKRESLLVPMVAANSGEVAPTARL